MRKNKLFKLNDFPSCVIWLSLISSGCWSSFLRQGYYSYDALTHEECKYEISTLFIAFQKQNYEIERKRNFREKKAKRGIFFIFARGKLIISFCKRSGFTVFNKKTVFSSFLVKCGLGLQGFYFTEFDTVICETSHNQIL